MNEKVHREKRVSQVPNNQYALASKRCTPQLPDRKQYRNEKRRTNSMLSFARIGVGVSFSGAVLRISCSIR